MLLRNGQATGHLLGLDRRGLDRAWATGVSESAINRVQAAMMWDFCST